MTRKQWTLLAVAVLLAGFSLYLNKDWFVRENIQIHDRSRPLRGGSSGRRRSGSQATIPILFWFDNKLKLTSIKVVPLSDIQTNKYPHPIWHLVSDSNSVPIKDFTYGESIPGMRPAVKDVPPDPLEPGVKYRLLVEAGQMKAGHDFVAVAKTP